MSIFKKRDIKSVLSQKNSSAQNAQSIKKHLNNNVDEYYYDSIDSTNSEAKRHTIHSGCDFALFVADHQTNGRGRLGRTFYSPSDTGLYMSLLFKNTADTENILKLTTATAVCVCESLEKLCGVCVKIKWVNDIYLQNKKVCGILCEAITDKDHSSIDSIVVGIGINLCTKDFPSDIKDIATSLNTTIDKNALCADITNRLIYAVKNISSVSFIKEYKERSLVLGKEIFYTQDGVTKSATALDIDSLGALIIKTDDGTKTLSSGEISVRVK